MSTEKANDAPAIDVKHGVSRYTHDFPPGTEVVDETGKEETIHYPMPTSSLNDPLNWSRTWKFITFGSMLWYLWWITFPLIGTSSMYAPFIVELNFSVDAISALLGWTVLLSGLGNLVWIPLANAYGRRPCLLVSALGGVATVVWFGKSSNYRSMLWARIILGFFMAPVECFAPMQIGDMFFTAQRARAHSIFFIVLLVSTSVGGAISGAFVDSTAGWRSYFYFSAGMAGSAFLVLLFFHPETAFKRTAASSRGVHSDKAVSIAASLTDASTSEIDEEGKGAPSSTAVVSDTESMTVSLVGKGKPSKAQLYGIRAGRDATYRPLAALWRVVQTLTVWPVWIAIGWFGAIKGILVGQNYVAAQIWQAPPYNFSNAEVGMVNIPAIVGTITGAIFWGWFSDWDLARRTRKAGGIREPEMRLWPIIPGTIIGVVGGVIYGLGAERQWRWEIILILGNTLNWFGFMAGLICSLSYAVDSYNRLGGEIGLLMSVFGNAWTFSLAYFVNEMLAKRGFAVGIALLMVPCYGMFFITIAYLFVGKQFRRWTANHPLLK